MTHGTETWKAAPYEGTAGGGELRDRESAGVYVHLPFCVVRCSYCDFYSLVDQDALAGAYTEALEREIREFPSRTGYAPPVGSVYIGGGTPSHLPSGSVARILG